MIEAVTGEARRVARCMPVVVFTVAVSCAVSELGAQNLLVNPSIEGVSGFVIPPGSCPPADSATENWYWRYQCIPEIEPPSWWYPFWNSGPTPVDPSTNYRRPEYRVYSWPDGPHYTYDGSRYLVFFGFFGAIDAGIYQQVSGVIPGAWYEFSYQTFAWSNCLDGKVPGSGLGCADFPPYQAVFKAGIDPNGGTDYASTSIVWSCGDSIYDAYAPVSVTAQAAASTITVCVRSTFWHNYIQHNDAHVDALQLIRLGPHIELDPQQISASAWLGDPAPEDNLFTVANSTHIDSMGYTITIDGDPDPTWLNVLPTQGSCTSETDPITVSYDVTGLPVGQYDATVRVTAPQADNSPQTVSVSLTIRTVKCDFDGDTDVDQANFGHLQECLTGEGVAQTRSDCLDARLDGDEDVDLADYAILQACMSGANVAAERTCAD